MLEIKINHIPVELGSDIQIPIIMENPFLLEDRIPAPYSLNFELPATAKNLELFKFPNRITSYTGDEFQTSRKKPCSIRFNGLEILKGHVVFLGFSEKIKLQFVGLDYNEFLKAPMNTLDMGKQYFSGAYNAVDYDNPLNFAYSYKEWANQLAAGVRGDMVAGPLSIVPENQPFTKYKMINLPVDSFGSRLNGFYTVKSVFQSQDVENINQYNPDDANFLLIKKYDLSRPTILTKSHASIFPAFRIGYLIDVIFGGLLLSNPFRDIELYDLVLPTYYFSKWKQRVYKDAYVTDFTYNHQFPPMVSNPRPTAADPYPDVPYIQLNDFLPAVACNDFIREILNLYCMSIFPVNGKLNIKTNDQVLNSNVVKDWSNKVTKLEVLTEKAKQYIYGYKNASEITVNVSEATIVNDVYDMMLAPYTLDGNGFYEEKFKIDNQVFLKRVEKVRIKELDGDIDDIQYFYSLLDDGFNLKMDKEKSEVFEITSSIKPLPLIPGTYFVHIDNSGYVSGDQKEWKVPALIGVDRTQRPNEIFLTYYKGMRNIKDENTRYFPSLNSNYDDSNTLISSLEWDGEHGLFNKYHKSFKTWMEKDKIQVNTIAILNPIDLKNLDLSEKVHVQGRNFFIKKVQYTIGIKNISAASLELLEA